MTNEYKRKLFEELVNTPSGSMHPAEKLERVLAVLEMLEEYDNESEQQNHGQGD